MLRPGATRVEGLLGQLIRPSREIGSQAVGGDAFETHENARCKQLVVLAVLLWSVHLRRMLIPDVGGVLDKPARGPVCGKQTVSFT